MERNDPIPVAAAICRDLLTLFGRVRLDLSDRGRLLPILAPADLWRVMPRLMRRTCDLAESLAAADPAVSFAHLAFVREIAATIEAGGGKAVAR